MVKNRYFMVKEMPFERTLLIEYVAKDGQYYQKNAVEKWNVIDPDKFNRFKDKVEIKRHKFRELVNEYFRTVKAEWMHNGYKFKKLPCFSEDGNCYDSAGEVICSIYDNRRPVVYFNNRLYLVYLGGSKSCLLDLNTKAFVRWFSIKNLSPIWNKDLKEVVYYNNI